MKYIRRFNENKNIEEILSNKLWKYIGDLHDASPIIPILGKSIKFSKSDFTMVKYIIDEIIKNKHKKIFISEPKDGINEDSYIEIKEDISDDVLEQHDYQLYLYKDEYFLLENDTNYTSNINGRVLHYWIIDGFDGIQDIMEKIFKE